jgi:alkylation response protein AidB-like acyl-CoA dehydrogenase
MELRFTAEQEAFRKEAREWLEANVPKEPLPSMDTKEGFAAHREWEKTLAKGRWGMVCWPEELGGRGADLFDWLIFEEEAYRVGAPLRVNQNGIYLLGPTLMEYGTEEQKKRFLPPMASSDEVWAQAWSEPNAGSDMAAIRTTAFLDESGENYIVNGQKTWASRGCWADWGFGLFRTEEGSERHKGLSMMVFPNDLEGITISPIEQLDRETGFAEMFFDNVKVPAKYLLGEEGKGWNVAMATAGFERGLMWMKAEQYALNTYRTVSFLKAGGKIGSEASLNKIFWSELDIEMHELALSILDALGEMLPHAPAAKGLVGHWLDGYMFALAGPIYAGTNEIQRNVIAERLLGLPRK